MKVPNRNNEKPIVYVGFVLILVTLGFYTEVNDPFNLIKFLIMFVSAGLLSGYLIQNRFPRIQHLQKYIKLLYSSTFVFVVGLFASTLSSDSIKMSLVGDTLRKNGTLTYLSLIVISTVIIKYVDSLSVKYLFRGLYFCGLVNLVYGFLQYYKLDVVKWNNPYNPIIGTFGNPNFASAFISFFVIFLFGKLIFFRKSKSEIYFLPLQIILGLFLISKSQSRQGLIVFAIGISVLILGFLYINKKFKLLTIFSMITIIGITLVTLGMLQRGPIASIIYKDSVSVRGFYWRAGIKMFLEHPIFGVGIDRYGSYFKEYREPGYPLIYGNAITSTNAHNVVIQNFATGGLFLGFAYLFLCGIVIYSSFKLIRSQNTSVQREIICLSAIWLGYFAQSLISIDFIGLSIWGWVFGSTLIGLYIRNSIINLQSSKADFTNKKKILNNGRIPASSILFSGLVTIVTLVPSSIMLFNANQSWKLIVSNPESNPRQTAEYANQVISLIRRPLMEPDVQKLLILNVWKSGLDDAAKSLFDEIYAKDSRNLDLLKILSDMETNKGNIESAIIYRKRILEFDPWNIENIISLSQLYKANKDENEIKSLLKYLSTFASDFQSGQDAINKIKNL